MSLKEMLSKYQREWRRGSGKWFIPINTLDRLLTLKAIKTELSPWHALNERLPSSAGEIFEKSKKLFAVLLLIEMAASIFDFLDEGILDEHLPLGRCDIDRVSNRICLENYDEDHPYCGCKVMQSWNDEKRKKFAGFQWIVLAPVFQRSSSDDIPHFSFSFNTIMPFIDDHEKEADKSGGYGEVWKVKIHPEHQRLINCENGDLPEFAIKRLRSSSKRDFKKEQDMLLALHRKGHQHIINLFATYEFDGRYHLVFPYANANLRAYWNAVGVPHKNQATFLWFLNQAHGIAFALNVIHNFTSDDSGRLGVPRAEDKYGRHGDIKPENILWFRDESGGILRIADFGLGKFHRAVSRSEIDPATIKGSQTYSPPEVALREKISRKYDIWTMGCMFLEFITWLLLGGSAIYEFAASRKVRAYDGGRDDTYFTVIIDGKSRKAIVRPEVEKWITKLRAHEACSPMISDFLNIIRECLKVAPKERLEAKDLQHRLGTTLALARNNSEYLLAAKFGSRDLLNGIKVPSNQEIISCMVQSFDTSRLCSDYKTGMSIQIDTLPLPQSAVGITVTPAETL